MKKQFVTYPIALALKEFGFNESCFGYFNEKKILQQLVHNVFYNKNSELEYARNIKYLFRKKAVLKLMCTAPLWQQVIDWFREKHQININPLIDHNGVYYWVISRPINSYEVETEDINGESWEIARETAILKAIEIIKKTNNQ